MAAVAKSRMRKIYFLRFLYRATVLVALGVMLIVRPETADIIGGTTVFVMNILV